MNDRRFVVALRGSEPYARALDRLAKAVRRAGVPVETPHQLAEHALQALAREHGIELPPRSRPVGTNRYTADGAG